uniref:Syntaxin-5 N-terminal Sly1p-binding domain-containing protein n=1 Tax=Accipiter nisus TaxID=211598 RepID=A0A8B9M018_9AVES
MNARRRHGSRQREPGVYLGPPQTQAVLPPPAPPPPPPPSDAMSCRDRTQEFLSACKSLQGRTWALGWERG